MAEMMRTANVVSSRVKKLFEKALAKSVTLVIDRVSLEVIDPVSSSSNQDCGSSSSLLKYRVDRIWRILALMMSPSQPLTLVSRELTTSRTRMTTARSMMSRMWWSLPRTPATARSVARAMTKGTAS